MPNNDANDNKYVNTDPNGVKKGDQNKAVIGPARLSVEEETQQQIDKGINSSYIANINVSGTDTKLGRLAPTYYHTSEYFGSGTYQPVYGGTYGFMYPVFVGEASAIDGLAVFVEDGLTSVTYQAYYDTRLGIYDEVKGMPTNLLVETNEFNWGNGSITSNTLHVETIPTTVLKAGRYWLAFKKKANAPDTGCRLWGRNMTSGTGPYTEAMLVADGAGMGWEVPWNDGLSTPTNFPIVFDFNDMKTGFTVVKADKVPEIFMRAA